MDKLCKECYIDSKSQLFWGRIDCRDDETTINLNGFGIYGPGADSSKVGIGASEDNVVVNGPGTISGFQAGILATGAKALAANSLIMQDNQIAVLYRSRHGLNSRKHNQE